jgi:negative regulator of flagellin synthesis FlgM
MTIGRISPLEPVVSNGKPGVASKTVKGDSVSISKEALVKAEQLRSIEIVASAPDVRAEKVAEMKIKINDPGYLENAITGAADSIIGVLFPGKQI